MSVAELALLDQLGMRFWDWVLYGVITTFTDLLRVWQRMLMAGRVFTFFWVVTPFVRFLVSGLFDAFAPPRLCV